jgi:hypothetical protein
MRNQIRFVMSSSLMLVAACGAAMDTVTDENIDHHTSALDTSNALNQNALNLNACNLNALNLNALDVAALSPSSIAALQDPGPSGDLARQLVRYAVNCALGSTQTFSFSWTDTAGTQHEERYPGNLGLAPYWSRGALNTSDERWISACLASRVNWYGIPVTLSARAPGNALPVSDAERSTFTLQEGVFFGNLFTPTPTIYSCFNADHVEFSRARNRDCAAGHLNPDGSVVDCGIIQRLGPCSRWCASQDPKDGYYTSCRNPQGTQLGEVFTIFLQ